MMRSSQPCNEINVTASVVSPRVPSMSGVCSECGTTYQVSANGGDEAWSCPRCGPSMPIVVKEPPAPRQPRRRARKAWPRVRIPFFLIQVMVVSLTFAVFLTSVLFYMNQFPSRRARTTPRTTRAAPPRVDLPRDPILRHQGISLARNANRPGSVPPSEGSGERQGEVTPETAVAALHAVNSSDDTDGTGGVVAARHSADATNVTARDPGTPETNGPLDTDEMITVVANSLTVREVFENSYRMFGREFVMQCKLVQIHDDAEGRVPHRFELGGQLFTLSDTDDAQFVRLEVMDVQGELFQRLFVSVHGKLKQELKWLLPGDWIVVTATTGLRYDDESSNTNWGLILTNIAALQEDTYSTQEAPPKKLAER